MKEQFSCALTGHRDLPAQFDRRRLFDELESIIRSGCTYFYCGMAEGFDLTALQLLIELKDRYPLFIEACVPFKGQARKFSEQNRLLYDDLILQCDKVTTLSDKYQKGCFLVRDRYMADRADLVFAYCTKKTGGTAYTVRYALSLGLKVIFSGAGFTF